VREGLTVGDVPTRPLEAISLVARNYGDGIVFEEVLLDWFDFLGGRPGEVVIVDAGSPSDTQDVYWELFKRGLIDKLQVIPKTHPEHDHERGFVQLVTAGMIASCPYLLWFNIDTLPYRRGHDGWVEEALGYLERDDVSMIGGAFNNPSKIKDAWDGWYYSDKCSLNLALMKRTTFTTALFEFADDFVKSGFETPNPAVGQERFFMEVAIEHYMKRRRQFSLCRIEDENWTVFHTNTHEMRLKETRARYRARKGIDRYMNLGLETADRRPGKPPHSAKALYYGQSRVRQMIKNVRIDLGATPLGPPWRAIKARIASKD
jgi:hypothetical protein